MDLFLSFSHVMSQRQKELRNNHTVIEGDDYRIEDMMEVLEERLGQQAQLSLDQVFKDCQSRSEMITLFLATLELIKLHRVLVEQEDNFGQIILRKEVA